MDVYKKFRGKQASVLMKYVQELEPALLQSDPSCVFVTHSGCDDTIVNEIVSYLENLDYFANVYVTTAGGVISSHCGPGTLGVLFYTS